MGEIVAISSQIELVPINGNGNTNHNSSSDESTKNESKFDKKQKTLSAIDNAKFGCFHIRAVLVSGVGFFTVIKYNPLNF
jgi:hypothetical protein